jgi:hypothetical protein
MSTGWQGIALNQLAEKVLHYISWLTRYCFESTGLSASWFKAIPCQPVDSKQYLVSQLIQSNTNWLTRYCFESTDWQDIALNQLADKILLWINWLTRYCFESTDWQDIAFSKQYLVSQLIQSNILSVSWFKAISCQSVDSKQYLVSQLI